MQSARGNGLWYCVGDPLHVQVMIALDVGDEEHGPAHRASQSSPVNDAFLLFLYIVLYLLEGDRSQMLC